MSIFAVGALLSLVVFGALGYRITESQKAPLYVTAANITPAQLISTSGALSKQFIQPDIKNLESELLAYTRNQPGEAVSLHFEYLPTRQTIDIDPSHSYPMMSLSKLPIIILLYQQSEAGLVDLDKAVSIEASDLDSQYGTLWLSGAGYQITLREAVQKAIEESDNTAIKLIRRVVLSRTDSAQNERGGLDVRHILKVEPDGISTNVVSYASMLSCLYTSCQTSPVSSRAILGYMTHTRDSAIRDGASKGTKVADKFGYFSKAGQDHLYSDCGIAYSSNGNYILCIMTINPTTDSRTTSVALSGIVQRAVAP